MKKSLLLSTAGCAIAGLVLLGQVATAADIKIGIMVPTTGSEATYGKDMENAINLAASEINKAGGVLGRKLELVARDCRNEQGLGVRLAEELIDEGVVYIIATTGDPALAQGAVACSSGVPISTGDGTAPTLVGDMGDCAFQICMSDNIQGALAAEYAYKKGYRKAFMVYSTEIPYTNNLPEYF